MKRSRARKTTGGEVFTEEQLETMVAAGDVVKVVSVVAVPSDPSEFYTKELPRLEAGFSAGNFISLLEGMLLCQSNEWPWPRWMQDAAIELTRHAAEGTPLTGKLGRHNSYRERFLMDRLHMRRWRAARFYIDSMKRHKERQRKLAALPLRKRREFAEKSAKENRLRLDAMSPADREVAECAAAFQAQWQSGRMGAFAVAASLIGETGERGAQATKRSYELVEKALRSGSGDRFLAAAGWIDMVAPSGKE
jgi:hypothetical protein